MKTTATAAEVREQLLISDIEEAAEKLAERISAQLDYDTSVELVLSAIESVSKEEVQACPPLDKIAWIARQSYLAGFLQSFRVSAEAARQGYNALFDTGEQTPSTSPISPCGA